MGTSLSDDLAALRGFTGVARLFPLPNVVLFPQIVQGLHVFEPRYRQMTADALAGDNLIALVLLKDGWEDDYDKRPGIESVGCLGRIVRHELLPDGRYDLRVRGLCRLRLAGELPGDKLYRTAAADLIPEAPNDDLPRLTALRRQLAEAVLPRFEPAGPAYAQLREMFAGDMPLGVLCDTLAYALPLPLPLRQCLLEEPNPEARADVLARSLQTPPAAGGRRFPPRFSPN